MLEAHIKSVLELCTKIKNTNPADQYLAAFYGLASLIDRNIMFNMPPDEEILETVKVEKGKRVREDNEDMLLTPKTKKTRLLNKEEVRQAYRKRFRDN